MTVGGPLSNRGIVVGPLLLTLQWFWVGFQAEIKRIRQHITPQGRAEVDNMGLMLAMFDMAERLLEVMIPWMSP